MITWFQNRINRAQLLLPATVLRERAEALQRRLSAAPKEVAADLPKTNRKLDGLIKELSEPVLQSQGLLPPKFPIPFRSGSPPPDAYKEYLAKRTQTILLHDQPDLAKTEPKKLRYRLLHVAARLVRGARRVRLKIDRNWPWACALATAFQRLRRLPLPAT